MKIGDIRVDGKKKWELLACHRCGGSGIYTKYHGECFRCGGVGYTDKDWYRIDDEAVKRREKYAEKKRKEAAEKFMAWEYDRAKAWDFIWENHRRVFDEVVKAEKKYEDWVNLDDDIFERPESEIRKIIKEHKLDYTEEFLVHTLSDGIERFRDTKDWIIEKAERLLKEKDEKEAEHEAAEDVPSGKVRITGEVLSVKSKDNGFGGVVMKCLVLDDRGFKVWGTASNKMFEAVGGPIVGHRFAFDANVEPSPDDPKFGFYKRPSKVEKL